MDNEWLPYMVCMTEKIQDYIEDEIIYAYVQLPFETIPTSTEIT